MKLQLSVDIHNGVAHSAVVMPANVHDKNAQPQMRHKQEKRVYGDNP